MSEIHYIICSTDHAEAAQEKFPNAEILAVNYEGGQYFIFEAPQNFTAEQLNAFLLFHGIEARKDGAE